IPRTYSNVEYADMVFVYGFCLLSQDYFKRLKFSNWFLEQFNNDNSFPSKII
ncbi:hypothetical protein ALC60_09360, partial [Trachymyrmex zeteki]